ncbi:MAG: hypothetical protein CM1200mP29_06410 [Verrucomicrobiota bacterium]|nr:MAG: hypothetical protein CM1200mP29_06410 [Verrucomicrobiota bacterium]
MTDPLTLPSPSGEGGARVKIRDFRDGIRFGLSLLFHLVGLKILIPELLHSPGEMRACSTGELSTCCSNASFFVLALVDPERLEKMMCVLLGLGIKLLQPLVRSGQHLVARVFAQLDTARCRMPLIGCFSRSSNFLIDWPSTLTCLDSGLPSRSHGRYGHESCFGLDLGRCAAYGQR